MPAQHTTQTVNIHISKMRQDQALPRIEELDDARHYDT